MLTSDTLKTTLARLVGPETSVAVQVVGDEHAPLYPEEAAAMTRAVASRRAEFQAGRVAARQALSALGIAPAAIPMGEDRAPIWPQGVTGSISHAGGFATAIIAPSKYARALGLDMETDAPLETELWPEVLTKSERSWLSTQAPDKLGHLAKLMFSIKECVYKAQYGLSRTLLEFSAFDVTLTPAENRFDAEFQLDVAPFSKGEVINGQMAVTNGMIVTVSAL